MADREIKIKVTADTSDFDKQLEQQERKAKRALEGSTRELHEARRDTAQAERSSARWKTVAAGAPLGFLAARTAAENRGWIPKIAQQTLRGAMLRGLAVGLVKTALPLAIGAFAFKKITGAMFGGGQQQQQEQQQTNEHLERLVQQGAASNQSLSYIALTMQQNRDILGRGREFQLQRSLRLGLGQNFGAVEGSLLNSMVAQDLNDARQAWQTNPGGLFSQMGPEFSRGRARVETGGYAALNRFGEVLDRWTQVGGDNAFMGRDVMRGGRRIRAGESMGMSPVEIGSGSRWNFPMALVDRASAMFGGPVSRAQRSAFSMQMEQQEDQRQRRNRLLRLEAMGLPKDMLPPPTIQAEDPGSVHAARVAQQARARGRTEREDYLARILEVLIRMAAAGDIEKERVEQFRVRTQAGFVDVRAPY